MRKGSRPLGEFPQTSSVARAKGSSDNDGGEVVHKPRQTNNAFSTTAHVSLADPLTSNSNVPLVRPAWTWKSITDKQTRKKSAQKPKKQK